MPKSAHSEKWYETELRKYLVKNNWWVTKLHGNIYQSGLPDWLLCSPEGKLVLIELKTIREKQCYYTSNIVDLLKGTQISNILLLTKKKAPLAIITGCNKGYLFLELPHKENCEILPCDLKEVLQKIRGL